jgi:hypothetical protein
MTIAVCFKCGAFKHGAITPCPQCKTTPETPEDQARSIAMSDHHYNRATLERISSSIQEGRVPAIDPALVGGFQSVIASDIGKRILGIFGNLNPSGQSLVKRPKRKDEIFENIQSQTQIARIVCRAFRNGEPVIYRENPFLENDVIQTARFLIKKPFFKSWSSFIPRVALESEQIFELFAQRIYLTAQTEETRNQFWDGAGNYMRQINIADMTSFSGHARLAAFGVLLAEPVYLEICPYLEEP